MENEYAKFGLPDDPRNLPPQAQPLPPRRGWFGRNWGWLLPLGILIVVLPCGCCGGVFWWVIGMFKSSEPYQMALQQVRTDPRAINELGEPIEERSWIPTGNFDHVNNGVGSGKANFDFAVGGPKGTAHVHADAVCRNGKWEFRTLDVTPAGTGKTISLLAKKKPGMAKDEPAEEDE